MHRRDCNWNVQETQTIRFSQLHRSSWYLRVNEDRIHKQSQNKACSHFFDTSVPTNGVTGATTNCTWNVSTWQHRRLSSIGWMTRLSAHKPTKMVLVSFGAFVRTLASRTHFKIIQSPWARTALSFLLCHLDRAGTVGRQHIWRSFIASWNQCLHLTILLVLSSPTPLPVPLQLPLPQPPAHMRHSMLSWALFFTNLGRIWKATASAAHTESSKLSSIKLRKMHPLDWPLQVHLALEPSEMHCSYKKWQTFITTWPYLHWDYNSDKMSDSTAWSCPVWFAICDLHIL